MSSNGICSFPTLKGPLIGSSDKRDILQFAFSTGRVILILLASSGIFSGIKPRLTKNSEVQVGEYLRFKISSSLQSTESCKLIFKSEKVFVIRSLRIDVVFSSKDNFKNYYSTDNENSYRFPRQSHFSRFWRWVQTNDYTNLEQGSKGDH